MESLKSHVVFEFDFSESHYSQFVKEKILTPEECSLICIRTKKWKYVHFPNLPALLFDLENDPHELVNLANGPKHKLALDRHRDILSAWIKVTGDKGQVLESDIGLLATMKRWGNLCVNPEYDRVRDRYIEWKASQ